MLITLKVSNQLALSRFLPRLYYDVSCLSAKYFSNVNGQVLATESNQVEGPSKDQVRLVYEGPMVSRIRSIKLLSLSTSVFGLAAQTFMFSKSFEEGSNISTLTLFMSSTMVLAFSMTPLLINTITKRYVYQLYYDSTDKSFTAYTLNLFNRTIKTKFNKSTLQLAPVASPFTTILVNNKPLFVDLKEIKDPEALELFV